VGSCEAMVEGGREKERETFSKLTVGSENF